MNRRHLSVALAAAAAITCIGAGTGVAQAASVPAPSQTAPAATPEPSFSPVYSTVPKSETAPAATPVPASTPTPSSTPAPTSTPARTPFTLNATVTGVDAKAGTVTVQLADLATATVAVGKGATIKVDGDTETLADLPVGAKIKLSGTALGDQRTAVKLEATTKWPFDLLGSIASVNAAGSTVTLATGETLPVDANARINLDGKASTLAKLPAGAKVWVSGTTTNGVSAAARITALSKWALTVDGTVTAVDQNTITLNVGVGRMTVKVNVPVVAGAAVTLNGKKVALSDLPVGATVHLDGTETGKGKLATSIKATMGKK